MDRQPPPSSFRHPIRQTMAPPTKGRDRRDDDQDLKLFVLSFTAFFICFYTLMM
jgi:hypothetical protein